MIDKCDIDKLCEGTTLIYNPVNNLGLEVHGTGFTQNIGLSIEPGAKANIINFEYGITLKFTFIGFLAYTSRLASEFVYENFDIL